MFQQIVHRDMEIKSQIAAVNEAHNSARRQNESLQISPAPFKQITAQ